VVNAVVDNSGTVINYSTGGQQIITTQGRVVQRPIQQQQQQIHLQHGGQHPHQAAQVVHHAAPMKDPNAPKKPLSAYFLFSQEERLKVKAEYADYSITEVAKELGRRWATIDPAVKQTYEQRYQGSRRQYEQAMAAYKPTKKKKDPNAPKQPLSAYFIFSSEERLKVKGEHPSYSICEVAKELGRRWADMSPDVKQRYQQMAEEGRQKYDQDMAAYRQGNYTPPGAGGETRVLGTNAAVESLSTATTQPVDGLREDNNTNSAATITGVAPEDKQVVVPPGGNPSAEAANNVVEAARTPVSTASAEATSYAGMENANDYSSLLQ
ncbi:High mobility group protein B2like, partial [Caligus rogercresseyi]